MSCINAFFLSARLRRKVDAQPAEIPYGAHRGVINGRRKAAAFGFKGKGVRGLLTPARMGKNGDQIHRLFFEDADVFLVQYGGQIASSVIQQMAVYAQAKSISSGRTILYGTINGQDSAALVAAYPKQFKGK